MKRPETTLNMDMAAVLLLLLTINIIACKNLPDNKFGNLGLKDAIEEDELVQQLMNAPYAEKDTTSATESTIEKIDRINERYRNRELYQGDINMHPNDPEFTTSSGDFMYKRNAVRDRRRLWINKVVPYEISEDLVSFSDDIKAALDDISRVSCVTFKQHSDEKTWIEFVQKDGCWSTVGRIFFEEGGQELSLGPGCLTTDTIIHEVMHALGFMHEQSRPDRDQYVKIYWENIKDGFEDNFKKYQGDEIDIQKVQYDYDSLMHYGRRMFAKNRRLPTMVAVGDENRGLGSNRLSKRDIVEINLLYDCTGSNSSFLSSWSGFSPCSDSCMKARQRFCTSKDLSQCPEVDEFGVETQQVACSPDECKKPIDGHWGRWTSWSACNVNCGWGMRKRMRKCDDPPPQNNGTFCNGTDYQAEQCMARPCSLGPFDCQFEFSFCHWLEESGPEASYEWKEHQGSTSSRHTGPDADHTYGNDKGHYLYAEASSPAEEDDTAVLESREFQPVSIRCLSFWYHMLGEDMGSLEVFLRDEKTGSNTPVWVRSGDQGPEWKQANVTYISTNMHRIVFVAHRGNGFRGDIAIDDVLFLNETCKTAPMTTLAPTKTTTEEIKTTQQVKTTEGVKTTQKPTTMKVMTTAQVKTTQKPTTMKVMTTEGVQTTQKPTTMKVMTTEGVQTTQKPTTMKVMTTPQVQTTQKPTTMKVMTTQQVQTTQKPTTMKVMTTDGVKTTQKPTTMKVMTTAQANTTQKPTTMKVMTTSQVKTTQKPTTMKVMTTDGVKTTQKPTTMKVMTTAQAITTQKPTTMKVMTTPQAQTTQKPTTMKVMTTQQITTGNNSTTMEMKTTEKVTVTNNPTTIKITTTQKVETTKGAIETTMKPTPTIPQLPGVELIGCYRDWGWINGKRPFPYYIDMRNRIRWGNMIGSFTRIIQMCRREVIKKPEFKKVFAIQFYGECWLGEEVDIKFERDGRLPLKACFKGLVGRSFSMMVYKITQ